MSLVVWDINLIHFEQLDLIKFHYFFEKRIRNKRISRYFSIEIRSFFRGMLGGLFFLHYNLNATGSLEYQFGSFRTTPWPHKISLFF